MKKRQKSVLGITLSLAMAFQSTAFALDDYRQTNKIDYMDRVFYFDMGEFLDGYEQQETIDEYAYYVDLLENLGVYTSEDAQKSSDSRIKKSEAYKIILNIILKDNIYSTKNMEADENITMYETISLMCDTLGYEKMKEMYGVEKIAGDNELLKGVSYSRDKLISFGEFSVILWNTLNARSMDVAFSGEGANYSESDEKFMESHLDIDKTVGYVNACNGLNIYKNSAPVEGYIEIDRAKFYVRDKNLQSYLGHRVTVYSRKNDMDENEILHIEYNRFDESVTIDFDDIVSVDSQIKYDDGSKTYKRVEISDVDFVMFNGEANADLSVLGNFEDMDGYVTLSKSEKSDKFDVAIINAYEYFVVYSIDGEERKIYLKDGATFNGESYIEVPEDNYVKCVLDGVESDYSKYSAGNVIRVLQNQSKTYTEIEGISKTITGKISGYDKDMENVTINDKEYKVSQSYLNRDNTTKIENGLYGTFYVSADNYIAGYKKIGDAAYGFMTKAVVDEETEKSYIEVFTEDNEWKKLNLKEKITLDGNESVLAENAVNIIKNNSTTNALIRYKVNGSDEVTFIDTSYDDVREKNDQERLVRSYAGTVTMSWMGGLWFRTDMGYRILNDRPVFEIPNNLTKKDEYKVIASSNLNKDESQIYITLYSANSLGLCQVGVISEQADNVQTDTTYWFYCEKVSSVWDEEEEKPAYKMEGKRITNGGNGDVVDFSVNVTQDKKESIESFTPGAIAPGALMRVTYNSDGYLTGADVKITNATLPDNYNDAISSYFQHFCGEITEIDVENGYLQMVCGSGANDKYVLNTNCIIVIDKNTKECRKIQIGELRVGERMFVFRSAGRGRICAVVR